ncbi:hypothetical protein C4573_01265 [Candidatus Woesearchaeota archaeon]|nr:MAG: hypothetical protein C4573_01265 [Candidatus Woesearchaeota archaeon]
MNKKAFEIGKLGSILLMLAVILVVYFAIIRPIVLNAQSATDLSQCEKSTLPGETTIGKPVKGVCKQDACETNVYAQSISDYGCKQKYGDSYVCCIPKPVEP